MCLKLYLQSNQNHFETQINCFDWINGTLFQWRIWPQNGTIFNVIEIESVLIYSEVLVLFLSVTRRWSVSSQLHVWTNWKKKTKMSARFFIISHKIDRKYCDYSFFLVINWWTQKVEDIIYTWTIAYLKWVTKWPLNNCIHRFISQKIVINLIIASGLCFKNFLLLLCGWFRKARGNFKFFRFSNSSSTQIDSIHFTAW